MLRRRVSTTGLRVITAVSSSSVSPTSPAANMFPYQVEPRRYVTTPTSPAQVSPVLGARSISEAFPNAPIPRQSLNYAVNPFTGRRIRTTAPIVAELASIGITLVNGEFRVSDPAAINALAENIRSGEKLVPQAWPMSMKQSLGVVLMRSRFTDAAVAVQHLIDSRESSRELSRNVAGCVGNDESLASLVAATDLTADQQAVLELVKRGVSIFLSGSAGTGKTVALREIIRVLKNLQLAVAVTATTGLAATHINGYTFHHLYGITRDGEFTRTSSCSRFDVLVIDEISMMTRATFEDLDLTLRRERNDTRPFGGVQLIACGDFMQLEPVYNSSAKLDQKAHGRAQPLFTSPVFREAVVPVKLTQQVRLTDDHFRCAVEELRYGTATPTLLGQVKLVEPGTQVPTTTMRILPRNKEVRCANERRMALLPGTPVDFVPCPQPTTLYGTWSTSYEIGGNVVPETLADAVHCRMTALGKGNIVRSRVAAFRSTDVVVLRLKLQAHDNELRIADAQLFDEAVEATVADPEFKAVLLSKEERGDGLQSAEIDALLQQQLRDNPIVQPLQLKKGAQVMLRSNLTQNLVNGSVGTVTGFVKPLLENLKPSLRTVQHIRSALQLYADAPAHEIDPMLPVVQFPGEPTETVIPPWAFTVGGDGLTHWFQASAVCIPLVPAYAFTVHKTQGMTINCQVHVELESMWACKHALYVLFSRVRRPEQLSLSGFSDSVVCADEACATFDRSIPGVQDSRVEQETPVAQWMFRHRSPAQKYRKKGGAASAATSLAERQTTAARAVQNKKIRDLSRIAKCLLAKSRELPAEHGTQQPLRPHRTSHTVEPSSQRVSSPLPDIPLLLSKQQDPREESDLTGE